VSTKQPPSRLDLEPACLEMAGGDLRNLTSKPAISGPDKESLDFDGNKQDFAEDQGPTHRGGAASPWPAPPMCEGAWLHL
jgi:hypothetical protein